MFTAFGGAVTSALEDVVGRVMGGGAEGEEVADPVSSRAIHPGGRVSPLSASSRTWRASSSCSGRIYSGRIVK